VVLVLDALPAAPRAIAAPRGGDTVAVASWLGSGRSNSGDAAGASQAPCEMFEKYKFATDKASIDALSTYAAQIYDNAQLPQPYHGVLSSNVLPAEGVSTLTFDRKLDEIEKSCVAAFLVDEIWGLRGLRRLQFRSVNVETFKQTSGAESTRIFFVIPASEEPSGWALYKPAYLIIGAFKKSGTDLVFGLSRPVTVSNRSGSRWGGILFAVVAYLCAAFAAWRRTGEQGRTSFTLNPVRITAGVLGDGSISQLQVFTFSLLVASLMFFLWLWTGLLSNISQDLLVLMGISSAGAVGAKYAATVKSRLSDAASGFLHAEGWFAGANISTITDAPSLGDLLLTNNRLDVYKFQMAIFSVLVAAYILGTGATDLGEVKISETLLYLIGISQGVYVGGKAISEREGSLDERVKSLIALKQSYTAETDTAKRQQIAADYLKTATAARADFQAIINIEVPDAKLRLA
jgi:hypothetical protein